MNRNYTLASEITVHTKYDIRNQSVQNSTILVSKYASATERLVLFPAYFPDVDVKI